MTARGVVLVVGGTGTLGRETVGRLGDGGRGVRVLTRDVAYVPPGQVEVAVGDVRDPSSLAAAVAGASAVVSAAHGFLGGRGAGPEEVDHLGNRNLVRAAVEAGVERFVLLSVLDARPDHPMSLHRAKYAAEQELRASPLRWTVLRPSSYLETWLGVVGGDLDPGKPALVLGRGDNPINFVSVQDVAALVVRALDDPDLGGETIDVPGPDNLTMEQLAAHLGATRVRHVPRGALWLLASVLAPWAPARARQARAALLMDSLDLTADASAFGARFPEVGRHRVKDVAARYRAAHGR